jgi:hypothetical protein
MLTFAEGLSIRVLLSDRGLLLELQRRKAELSGEYQLSSQETGMRMLTYAGVCWRMLTYPGVS